MAYQNMNGITEADYLAGTRPRQQPANRSYQKPVLLAALVLAALVIIFSIVNSLAIRGKTGLLELTLNDSQSKVELLQSGSNPYPLGSGSLNVRLYPGDYTLRVKDGDKQALKSITVEKQATTTAAISLEAGGKSEKIANYNAGNVFAASDSVFFINKDTQIPNVMKIGDTASRPIAANSYAAVQLVQADNSNFYVSKAGNWSYYSNGNLTRLIIAPLDANALSFNSKGGYAYVDAGRNVMLATSPSATPAKVSTVPADGYGVALSDNNSLLVYSSVSSNKDQRVQVITNGQVKYISNSALATLQFANWSPDSSKIVFNTSDGVGIYTLSGNKITTVSAASPTNPQAIDWLNGTDVVFAQNNAIWKFSSANSQSTWLSDFEYQLSSTNPLNITNDGAALYYGTNSQSADKRGGVYRIVLDASKLSTGQSSTTTAPAALTFSGLDVLTDRGFTSDQLANVQYALGQYVKTKRPSTKAVSIAASDIASVSKDIGAPSIMNLSISFDGTKAKAQLQYDSLSTVRLQIYNGSTVAYDSGELK